MKITVDDVSFNVLFNENQLKAGKTPILFLHGFTGSAEDWLFLTENLPENYTHILIDLIGHGNSDSPENPEHYTTCAIVSQINSILIKLGINRFVICGYSLGGRASIAYSCRHPEKIIGAIFESSTAGIDSIELKKERVELDFLLADKIRNEGLESFIEFWFDTPLFYNLKSLPIFNEIKNKRLKNNVIGLANMLTGFSTGLMQSCWQKIGSLKAPVLLVTGENDPKYTELNQELKFLISNAQHEMVKKCGHNVHLEKPELFTKLVLNFLNKL